MALTLYDVIIVGSGGAGCAAALEASRYTGNVLLVTKSNLLASNSSMAQGGIQAAVGKDDSTGIHYDDSIKAGDGHSNKALVRIMTNEAPQIIDWLEHLGVTFDIKDGSYKLKKGAGMTRARLLSCGDRTGLAIMECLVREVEKTPVEIKTFHTVEKIEKKNKGIRLSLNHKGEIYEVETKAVVITTGGSSFFKASQSGELTTNHPNSTGEIIPILKKLGIKFIDEEMFQYHPTVVVSPVLLRGLPIPEPVRSMGAKLLNKHGEQFADEMITRNKLSSSILDENKKGNTHTTKDGFPYVKLTTESVDEINGKGYLEEQLPSIYKRFKRLGIEINKQPVFVYPALHYQLGGISINEKCETNIEAIFAAGEVTGGIHGSERLIGNSLLDILVFGRRAGIYGAKYALER